MSLTSNLFWKILFIVFTLITILNLLSLLNLQFNLSGDGIPNRIGFPWMELIQILATIVVSIGLAAYSWKRMKATIN